MNEVVRVRSGGRVIPFVLAVFAVIAGCTDEGPGGVRPPTPPEPPQFQMSALECSASVGRREILCAPAEPGLDAASAVRRSSNAGRGGLWTASSDPGAGDASLIIGGQGVYVTLASSNIAYENTDSVFSFDVTVRNHIGQPLGTTDGSTLHAQGVRVFFQQPPMGTGGVGPFAVLGDGTATFTAADQPYYQFNSIIEDGQVSGVKRFAFKIPSDTDFTFRVLVWAPVQWPEGWVAVAPRVDTLNVAVPGEQSVALTGTVYSRVGLVQAETITWATSDPGVAIVEPDGLVTGIGAGTATITGSATGRASGTAMIVVIQPADLTKSTVTSSAPSVTANGSGTLTVTVQLKDTQGHNLTTASGVVALSNSGGGTLGTVSYEGNGKYTATLTAPTVVGVDTISATYDGGAITDRAAVEYTPGPPAQLALTTEPSSTAQAGTAFTQQPVIQVQDAHGNAVGEAGFAVAAAIGSGSGTLAGTTTVSTNASGVAAFTDLSLTGTSGSHTLSFTASGLNPATSGNIALTHGALDHFLVEGAAGGAIASQLAGTPFNVRITARDPYNNTVTSFPGTVAFTSTPGGAISAGGTSAAFTAGVLASHSITLGTAGSYVLTATRSGGTESGSSATFEVQAPPTAVNEGPAGGSNPGEPFHAFYSVSGSPETFTLAAPGALSNDNLGFPAATITSWGADSLGGSVTTYAAGSTVSPLPGTGRTTGSLTVNANGSISFTPPDGFTGNYVFRYRLTNVRGTSDAQVTIAVGARPHAANDIYPFTLVGNVPINTATSTKFRVTTNDQGDGKVLAVTGQTNGTATLNADSTFTFRPTPGYEGSASFTYTVSNGFGTSAPATVSMTVGTPIWFVNAAAGAGGDGRYDAPFNSLPSLAGINNGVGNNPADGDRIFLYTGSYTGGLTLRANQRLIGQGAIASFSSIAGVTWPADAGAEPTMGGTAPTITTSAAGTNGVNLGSGNTLRGFNLGNATGAALSGSGFGTLTISEVGINTNGQALNLTNGTLSGSFPVVRSTGGTNNIYLSSVATSGTSTLGANADALSGASGDALRIDGGNGSFTYSGSITNTATLAVNITGKNGGTVTLSGDINPAAAARGISVGSNSNGTTINFTGANQKISTGTTAGVTLASNTGANVNFTGGALAITTTTGSGFNVSGGGTVTVTGSSNTIGSTGGVALNVANTTIGASGLVFRSIAANGGNNGIVLNNTGSSGGLSVTGTGSAGSGGTIQNMTGADGSTNGTGVYLNSTRSVSLRHMQLNDHQNFAIRGNDVVGFTLAGSVISGTNGTNADQDEASVAFTALTGSARISSTSISGGIEDNFRVRNSGGTLDRIVFDTVTVGANGTPAGNDGINLLPSGTAVMRVTVQNSTFTSARGDLFQLDVKGTANSDLVFSSNTLSNNHGNIVSGGGGVTIVGGGLGSNMTLTYNISGNTFRDAKGHGLLVSKAGGAGTMTGTVSNNQIGLAGTANSGSQGGSGLTVLLVGGGTHNATVTNNQIRQYNNHGILVQGGDNTQGGHGTLNTVITGNTIANPGNFDPGGLPGNGIHLNAGTVDVPLDQHQFCVAISGNSMAGSGLHGGTDFRLRQRQQTTVRLPGYAGGNTNTTAVTTFIQGSNSGTTGSVTVNVPPGGGFVGGASCL